MGKLKIAIRKFDEAIYNKVVNSNIYKSIDTFLKLNGY